ncbi:hypothetical protein HPL003_02085 [Paenibacillus terrae HPL-003]|uniref:Uncharacterized protein n=1 Tax=Paenibacillus terrae (strain HPL-003) TaxID=985665 RepID=G7VY23_PAETH|nr:hypothetical protein HPL003_02085 [Paenibacillus terrae HPL-003]
MVSNIKVFNRFNRNILFFFTNLVIPITMCPYMNKTANEKPAHLFLASLGKTRLRPGGKAATERILEACQITPDTKLLEVAPNMGTTAMIGQQVQLELSGNLR